MSIAVNLKNLLESIPAHVRLIAVSKTKTNEMVMEAYHAGQRAFGENMVQELVKKQEFLPKDIEWHLIGHLQTNKVKYIAPFVSMIHSVDSYKLLHEINKRAAQHNRVIECLLQIHIAREETKFGLDVEEAEALFRSEEVRKFQHIRISGFMGMATNTDNQDIVRNEFKTLKDIFERFARENQTIRFLSMGMSSDYIIAIEEGSNMIRVGSVIFGER